jgi:hypothetical protein
MLADVYENQARHPMYNRFYLVTEAAWMNVVDGLWPFLGVYTSRFNHCHEAVKAYKSPLFYWWSMKRWPQCILMRAGQEIACSRRRGSRPRASFRNSFRSVSLSHPAGIQDLRANSLTTNLGPLGEIIRMTGLTTTVGERIH